MAPDRVAAPAAAPAPAPPAPLTAAALTVLEARYLVRGPDGRVVETPAELFRRVAAAVAEGERRWGGATAVSHWTERFHARLAALEFLPNSPTLMNAGMPGGQLSACFVLPVDDSIDRVLGTLQDVAAIQRTGGGTGFSFSRVRPAGDGGRDGTEGTDGTQGPGGASRADSDGSAAGPVSFIRLLDAATEVLRHGGRRRGANMAVLAIDHPDVQAFIEAKRDGSLRNFNLSVGVTDAFLRAVEADGEHALVHPATGRVLRRVRARGLFEQIVEAAWATGDPGVVFLDALARGDPLLDGPPIEATNPCGEVPLRPHEACNLGSLNLARFVADGRMDEARLREAARDALRFLDDVVETNRYPTPAIEAAARATRKVGLGVMGFAEALVRLGVPYGSKESVRLADRWMHVVREAADEASRELATERGAFPLWSRSRAAAAGKGKAGQAGKAAPFRNATRTSIAPTGTIAIIAGTTPGIEPIFALAFRRENVLGGRTLHELNPLVEEHLRRAGRDPEPVLRAVRAHGHLPDDADPALRRLFVTALDVPPERHLAIQEAFQRHVDNAVSKTVNLPADATVDDVRAAYLGAWQRGLKGITVYRYGSKSEQVMVLGTGQAAAGPVSCGTADCEV